MRRRLPAAIRQLAQLDDAESRVRVRAAGRHGALLLLLASSATQAERRAADLHARGLKKGDRLAIVVPDPDEFVLSFLGAVMGGIVPVPIYPQLSFKNVESYHDTVTHIANASGASMLLTTPTTQAVRRARSCRAPRAPSKCDRHRRRARQRGSRARSTSTIDPSDLAFLQFTSGSTSRPKGVMVTHGNLAWNSESFMIHGLEKDSSFDKGVSWLPLFHDMGLIGFVIGPLFTNIPVVFLPTASFVRNPRIWLDKIHQHRGTITYAPNFAYALVTKRVKEKDVGDLDLSCLRAPAAAPSRSRRRPSASSPRSCAPAKFDARAFLPSYGMAEATLAITFVPAFTGVRSDTVDKAGLEQAAATPAPDGRERRDELVNCGHAFPEHEIAIVDESGKRLGDRQVGQIVTRGPSISKGYYQEPELTAAQSLPRPGPGRSSTWLYTGDLGYIDRRRGLHLRPPQGHDHRPRPQLLPERHRVGRERAARRAPRQRRRVLGRDRRRGAARRRRRGHVRRRPRP